MFFLHDSDNIKQRTYAYIKELKKNSLTFSKLLLDTSYTDDMAEQIAKNCKKKIAIYHKCIRHLAASGIWLRKLELVGSCFGLKTEKNLITTSHVFTVINFTGLCFKTCDHCLSSTIVYYSESWGRGEKIRSWNWYSINLY